MRVRVCVVQESLRLYYAVLYYLLLNIFGLSCVFTAVFILAWCRLSPISAGRAAAYWYISSISRLKATAGTSPGKNVVSNAQMRYVADPLSEDPGVPPPRADATKKTSVSTANPGAGAGAGSHKRKKGGGKKSADAGGANDSQEQEEGGRRPILQVLRECVGGR